MTLQEALNWLQPPPGGNKLWTDETIGIVCDAARKTLAYVDGIEAAARWHDDAAQLAMECGSRQIAARHMTNAEAIRELKDNRQ